YWTNQLLNAQIGKFGVGGLIVFAYLAALVLIYNLDLKFAFSSIGSTSSESENSESVDYDLMNDKPILPKNAVKKQEEEEVQEEEMDIDGAVIEVSNTLRTNRPTLTVNDRFRHLHESEPEDQEEEPLQQEEEVQSVEFELQPSDTDSPVQSIDLSVDSTPLHIEQPKAEEEVTLAVEEVKEERQITADDLVAQFGQYDPKLDLSGYQYPTLDLLKDHGSGKITINQQELEANKNRIVDTLRNYNIEIEHIKATIGPTVTLYEIIPKQGVRISKIKNLEDDIALSLAALGIRIIAPMPGKGTIGIEVPNSNPEMVSIRSVLATEKFQKTDMDLPIALGKTISNEVYIADLAKMPHLLVAGATGQGKSVGINAILTSLLYKKHPAELKFVLVDPKKVELSLFKKIERHFLAKLPGEDDAIITDTKKVINTLNSLCIEMDQRYDLLKNAQVRNLKEYNAKFINRRLNP